MNTQISVNDFIKTSSKTAEHFGFQDVEALREDPQCTSCKPIAAKKISASDRKNDALHGILTAGINTYFQTRLYGIEGPVLFYTFDRVPRTGEIALTLHAINVPESTAEILLIAATRSLLQDLDLTDHHVRINTLGDRDSMTRYTRELTHYLRKRIEQLTPQTRELMKEHALLALMEMIRESHELSASCPSPLEHLTDTSRKHFRSIIEYFELSNIPYEIDNHLLGHQGCYSDTLFAIETDEETPALMIRGGRYDELVRTKMRRQIPATGATIILNKKANAQMPKRKASPIPSIFVVHLGFEPKVRTLSLLDELKRAEIPVYQHLTSNSLSEQLRRAEAYNVPYTIILGQKEYMEGTVILRDMRSRSQECIPTDALVSRLRKVAL